MKKLKLQKNLGSLVFVNVINRVITDKWYIQITVIVNKEYLVIARAMVDSGVDFNCINEGLIPSRYFSKTSETLNTANGKRLSVDYKLENAVVCNDGVCLEMPFIMVKDLSHDIILGNPFLHMLYPIQSIDEKGITSSVNSQKITFKFITQPRYHEIDVIHKRIKRKENILNSLSQELNYKKLAENLKQPAILNKIKQFQSFIEKTVCSNIPNAFWERKKHIVHLPYELDFKENSIPTKARPIAMGPRHTEICKKEIDELLLKKLIRPSYSPWSCPAFYVENAAELERGVPRLVINYKPLNKALRWIRYPIPNKRDLLNRLYSAKLLSKFDMKSGFWQVQIAEEDRYKTAFTVPFEHYEWNVMPFGLKIAPLF